MSATSPTTTTRAPESSTTLEGPREATRDAWLEARRALLVREKAFSRERDALSAARRALPKVRVAKSYTFETPDGERTLTDLFLGRRQLIVYHFMFDPSWTQGCRSCSLVADTFDGAEAHLPARDTSFVAVSRAPLATIAPFKARMGFSFRWVSSSPSDFNYDYNVSFRPEDVDAGRAQYNYKGVRSSTSEAPGVSVFLRDGDAVFHTYSTYGRGLDILISTYNYLDLTPFGRDEVGPGSGMAWVRHHDAYEARG